MPDLNLEKTLEEAKRRFRRIQRSPEKTKKRYLVALSSLAMIVVIGLWFFYLNVTLPEPAVGETEEVQGAAVSPKENENSFFRTVGRGAENIFEDLKNQIIKIKDDLSRVREFTLEGGGADFTPSP